MMFHFLVDRYHVGTPDQYLLEAVFNTSLENGKNAREWDAANVARVVWGCLLAHRENMDLYRSVMG